MVSALRASCILRTEITSPKFTGCGWQALQPPGHRSMPTASQASPHYAPGSLHICVPTLPGSIPVLCTEGLPAPRSPSPHPPKASRLNAERLPKSGRLPAPKIHLVIRGTTVLASICGPGAAAVTERGLPPWHRLVAHWGLFSPKSKASFQGPEEGSSARLTLCRGNPYSGLPGKIQLHSRMPSPCSLPFLLSSSPSHPSSDKQRRGLGPGPTDDVARVRSQEHGDSGGG